MWPFNSRRNYKAREPTSTQGKAPDGARQVSRARADVSLTGSEAIYAAVSRISNTMASLPVHLYKGHHLQEDHPLEKLVAYSPTLNHTPFTFLQTMEAFRNTEGRAYAFMVPNAMDTGVDRLDIIDPAKVTPIRIAESGETWYRMVPDLGKELFVPGCRVLVLKYMSANGEMGVRPMDVLRGTLDYDRQIKEFSLQQLEGVNNGVALNVPGTGLSEDRKKNIIQQFLDAYRNSGGRLVVLEGGVTATTLSQSPVDANVTVRNTKRVDTYGVKLNVDKIPYRHMERIMGRDKDANGVQIIKGSSIAPYVAIGFACTLDDGSKEFWWLYKGTFAELTKSAKTQADKAEYQTPTVEGIFIRRQDNDALSAIADTTDKTIPTAVFESWYQKVYEPMAQKLPALPEEGGED